MIQLDLKPPWANRGFCESARLESILLLVFVTLLAPLAEVHATGSSSRMPNGFFILADCLALNDTTVLDDEVFGILRRYLLAQNQMVGIDWIEFRADKGSAECRDLQRP